MKFLKLLGLLIVSKSRSKGHAGNRAKKTLLGASKTLEEIQRLCAATLNHFLLDSCQKYGTFDFVTRFDYVKKMFTFHYCSHNFPYF